MNEAAPKRHEDYSSTWSQDHLALMPWLYTNCIQNPGFRAQLDCAAVCKSGSTLLPP